MRSIGWEQSMKLIWSILLSLALPGIAHSQADSSPKTCSPVTGQHSSAGDAARDIWDTGFVQKRPAAPHAAANQHSTIRYLPEKAAAAPKLGAATDAVIGLTLWRLRKPTSRDDEGSRLLIPDYNDSGDSVALVPERIDFNHHLHENDRIRLSIEAPYKGYLYVIDRESYRDGTTGDPVLLFPIREINQGNNETAPGRVIDIPSEHGRMRALRISRGSEQTAGEDILLLVTGKPLPEITLTDGPQKLDPKLVENWDKLWSRAAQGFNLAAGQNKTWTGAERQAGEKPGAILNQGDPLPQTIMSTVPQGEALPVLIHLPLVIE
jgi:hypothetical protein